jgi:hypothetical protein
VSSKFYKNLCKDVKNIRAGNFPFTQIIKYSDFKRLSKKMTQRILLGLASEAAPNKPIDRRRVAAFFFFFRNPPQYWMPFVVFLRTAPTFSSVTPVTGSQMLFAVFGGFLRFQVIRSSALSLFSLPFPTPFRIFLSFSSLWRPASNRILVELLGVRKEKSALFMWY